MVWAAFGVHPYFIISLIFLCSDSTLLTRPRPSGKTSTIRPKGSLSSTNKTSTWRFFLTDYLWRSYNVGKYPFVDLEEKRSARYSTCFQHFRMQRFLLSVTVSGLAGDFRVSNIVSVSGVRSFGSSESAVRGLLLIIASTSYANVTRLSAVSTCCWHMSLHARWNISPIPSFHLSVKHIGGLKLRRISYRVIVCVTTFQLKPAAPSSALPYHKPSLCHHQMQWSLIFFGQRTSLRHFWRSLWSFSMWTAVQ